MSQQPTEKENLPTQSDKTTKILDSLVQIIETLNQSFIVDMTQIIAHTTQNCLKILVSSGGKPAALILSTSVLIITLAIFSLACKLPLHQPLEMGETGKITPLNPPLEMGETAWKWGKPEKLVPSPLQGEG